jgi:DNA-binding transcriptional LysR family regulator
MSRPAPSISASSIRTSASDMSWPRPCNPRPHPARAPLLAIYRKRYPGVEIRLVENGSDRLEEILAAGDIDFAASIIPVAEGLEWQSVKLDPLMVLVPAPEFAARKKSSRYTQQPARSHLGARRCRHRDRFSPQDGRRAVASPRLA